MIQTSRTSHSSASVELPSTGPFFSFSPWKKRGGAVQKENSIMRDSFSVNKSLPPLPPPNDDYEHIVRSDSPAEFHQDDTIPSIIPTGPSMSPSRPSVSSSTVALAQAALGIGLPHVLRHVSPSSSSSDLPESSSNPVIRRVKSSHRMRPFSGHERTPATDTPKRTRGLSLGTTSFLNFGSSDAKGKGKEPETPVSPQKTLTRRASFWSPRKKSLSSAEIPVVPVRSHDADGLFVPLPLMLPSSPLMLNSFSSSDNHISSHHSRGLSRSRSERANSFHLSQPPQVKQPDDVASPKPRRKPRRPATADASAVRSNPLSFDPAPSSPPVPEPEISHKSPNTPILHRLSLNLLLSSTSASNSTTASPVPTNSSRPSLTKTSIDIPKPFSEEESLEGYVSRLVEAVSKSEVAAILASSTSPVHTKGLRSYIGRFDFSKDPLDIALRRLLMDVGLPRETQQIDRVMEAFAARYVECNPDLFLSEDHPYVLAFSLIMLHTDAFNKSNKRKMTKADYIKNTRLPGVAPEVLDCFYDNIVFAPFIFVEDPLDLGGPKGLAADTTQRNPSVSPSSSGSLLLGKNNKVDPYYLISNNLLGPLRVNVELHVPSANPYSSQGTSGPFDSDVLHQSFASGSIIEVTAVDQARPTSAFFGLSVGGPPSPMMAGLGGQPDIPQVWNLRVTKSGTLNRKDDVLEGGKKASSRRWRSWGVMLTGSQLLFFRDPAWTNLISHSDDNRTSISFKPDEQLPIRDTVAVYDHSYTKHHNTLRLVLSDGRQFLLEAPTDKDLNEWISHINYASAFKTAGVRMRPLGMSGKDVQLTGVAAATSHLHDLQHMQQSHEPKIRHWGSDSSRDLMAMLSPDSDSSLNISPIKRRVTLIDIDVPVAPEVDGADQFKATFDQVKVDLAAGRRISSEDSYMETSDSDSTPPSPLLSSQSTASTSSSRSHAIQGKIRDLQVSMTEVQSRLDTELRLVRNIAILTPFQRSTRDRLLAVVQRIAKHVQQARLDIVKLTCHRDVLVKDLEAEGRHWHISKKIALKAATQTLESQRKFISVPRITVPPLDPSGHRPEPTRESFHSALEFGPEWSNDSDWQISESPIHIASSSMVSLPGASSPRSSDELRMHEKFYTAHESMMDEQAEDWHKTRCAQRVSLVRMPSRFLGMPRFEPETPVAEQ
ncbi:hypothetical protein C8J56DRAFT_311089 [Mycena floridula]|nr:hypothetical protein C8J56DRAFT_311089 [Mycena floridula]